MGRFAVRILVALCLLASGSTAAGPWSGLPELEARAAIQQLAQKTYRAGHLEELDERMEQLVRDSTRTSSGLWVSGIYSSGVKAAVLSSRPQTDEAWDELERQTLSWARQRPKSALARLIHAEVLERRAWQIRGGGYAHTVAEEAWVPFHAELRKAEAYLQREKAIAGTVPEYYLHLATIAKGLGKPRSEIDALLEECDRNHPGYYPIYFAILDYLLPKWHGDASEIERFARAAAQRTRVTEGDSMYARIYWYAAQGDFKDDLFWSTNAQWALMKRGFEDVVARYPDQWNYQNYARFACEAGDNRTLAELMSRYVRAPMLAAAWKDGPGLEVCERRAGRLSL